jgi:uncharacterized protein (TIGR03083 family)
MSSGRDPATDPRVAWQHRRVDDRDLLLAALTRDTNAFRALLRDGDLDAAVPDCPGWTLGDLADHLGGVHAWAHGIVTTGSPSDPPAAPSDRSLIAEWYGAHAADLVAALTTTDPSAEAWTFGPPPRTVAFWVRRQPLETAVHLSDAQRALGESTSLDPWLAETGVDEAMTMMFPRQVRLGRIPPLTQGVRLELTDAGGAYVLAGDGLDPRAAYDATLRGSAEHVFLWLWGRLSTSELDVEGDAGAVAAAHAAALTP